MVELAQRVKNLGALPPVFCGWEKGMRPTEKWMSV